MKYIDNLFKFCSSLTSINISNFVAKNVENMDICFLDISNYII